MAELSRDDVLPCDVLVAPGTIIRAGCNVSTLLLCLGNRVGREIAKLGPRGEVRAPQAVSLPELQAEVARLTALVNSPELRDFSRGVELEAAHQRERWGNDHDAGKEPADWFWLIGYLAGKALNAHVAGNADKAMHHTISTAAACANWHGAITGQHNMRPGIDGEAALSAAPAAATREGTCDVCDGTGLANVVDPDDGALVIGDCPNCPGDGSP